MLGCPGCGADLRYDINKGRLTCAYCGSDYSPEDKRLVQRTAGEEELIDAKVFTCPQCGGEMYTTDIDATAYCSYCGASNVLSSRLEGVDRPQKIIPFTVTREECMKAFHDLARRSPYVPSEFKKETGDEKLRPLYVPYRLFDLTLDGDAELYGESSTLEGTDKRTDKKRVKFGIYGEFNNIAFDASSAFDDTLAEQIAPFNMEGSRPFDSVYLAGSYANIPDTDTGVYEHKTLELAAQKCLDAMQDKFTSGAVELADYPDGSTVADHLPVKEMQSGGALFPVWFLSFRRGNRIAYAAVNGQTGKVYSDLPVSLPAFWAGCLGLALPIFLLLNFFVTMRPTTGLLLSCLLALLASVLYASNDAAIKRREQHLDDAGYRGGGNKEGPAAADHSLLGWIRGRDQKTGSRMRTGFMGWLVRLFMVWPYIVIAGLALYFLPVLFWAGVLIAAAIYCIRKAGGKITFWPALLILLAAAGFVIRNLNLVSDLWSYGISIAVLTAAAAAMTRLILQYNLLSTRPLPLLFKEGRVPKSTLLALLLCGGLAAQALSPLYTEAAQTGSAYEVLIQDGEDLLTEEEEGKLQAELQELTVYGNAVFVSCSQDYGTALDYARKFYFDSYGDESGSILLIDMNTREIAIYSAGWNNTVVRAEEGYVITDNVYRYASAGDYYGCAHTAFEQIGRLLRGGDIPRPMKYINNALLALILSVLINYMILVLLAGRRGSGRESMVAGDVKAPTVGRPVWRTMESVTKFSFVALCTLLMRFILRALIESAFSGGGGSSGDSSGGSFGGSSGSSGGSGSGGSHRF